MVIVATIGAAAIGAGATVYAANSAADAQKSAADSASATQMNMFTKMQGNLQPYMDTGTSANNALTGQLPSLTAPINMNESTLQNTPGYQFNLTQGLKATQSAAAARGLGVSGAALKGAATYATGLADSTYQNQFNNANTNRQTTYNMLSGQQSLGENAAAGVGNAGIQTGNSIASNTIGAGNAQAAADMAMGKAVGGAASSIPSGMVLNNLLSNNMAGGSQNSIGSNNYFDGLGGLQ
jgi:hypothetical protein